VNLQNIKKEARINIIIIIVVVVVVVVVATTLCGFWSDLKLSQTTPLLCLCFPVTHTQGPQIPLHTMNPSHS
jgi:flagellar basal body-associated protein FliL